MDYLELINVCTTSKNMYWPVLLLKNNEYGHFKKSKGEVTVKFLAINKIGNEKESNLTKIYYKEFLTEMRTTYIEENFDNEFDLVIEAYDMAILHAKEGVIFSPNEIPESGYEEKIMDDEEKISVRRLDDFIFLSPKASIWDFCEDQLGDILNDNSLKNAKCLATVMPMSSSKRPIKILINDGIEYIGMDFGFKKNEGRLYFIFDRKYYYLQGSPKEEYKRKWRAGPKKLFDMCDLIRYVCNEEDEDLPYEEGMKKIMSKLRCTRADIIEFGDQILRYLIYDEDDIPRFLLSLKEEIESHLFEI